MVDVVLYHKDCSDGMGAAWAAWKAHPEAKFVAAGYDDTPDFTAYADKHVVLVDFCYKAEQLLALSLVAASVAVIDHHKTAVVELQKIDPTFSADGHWHTYENMTWLMDMAHSGASLTWSIFSPVVYGFTGAAEVPKIIQYIEDRDLWTWKLPNSKEISAFIFSYPLTLEAYDRIADSLSTVGGYVNAVNTGARILEMQNEMAKRMADEVHFETFIIDDTGNLEVIPCCNVPQSTRVQSEVGTILLERFPEASFSACYAETGLNLRRWSLRSRPKPDGSVFDVSALAARHGGGGHKQAAGFSEIIGRAYNG